MQETVVKTSVGILLFVTLVAGVVFLVRERSREVVEDTEPVILEEPDIVPVDVKTESTVIGTSVEGRPIEAYTYGDGSTEVLFVGGIHGGYEWSSTLLAYEFIDYLREHINEIPSGITVTVVPSANPDGLFAVTGKEGRFSADEVKVAAGTVGLGRFNANGVDLNRNFDCKWKPESIWRGNVVSAGTASFSEPEARAIRDLVLARTPRVVVFWHSQANAVYASECEAGILPDTLRFMNTYAIAAKYPAVDTFDAYEVTGDAEGWLASINVPAITVELKTHETTEWTKNLAGSIALLREVGDEANQISR